MSLNSLTRAIAGMPSGMADSIVSYARSVEVALPDIFRDAQRKYRKDIADQIVFLAGVKKLFSIIDSTYWMLDNSSAILERQEISVIKVGSSDLSRSGEDYHLLKNLRQSLVEILSEQRIYHLVSERSYSNIIKQLMDERRSD